MIQSAYILPLISRIDWWEAIARESITDVDASAALDITLYANRDRELAYRDLVVASALTSVALKVTDVWGFATPYPATQAQLTVGMDQGYNPQPLVSYAKPSSLPVDALATDAQLAGRDQLMYQSLYRAAEILVANPVSAPGATSADTDVWALANGVSKGVTPGPSNKLDEELFNRADRHLVWRDNVLAAHIAAVANSMADIYATATRLLVQATEHGRVLVPEVYMLTAEDDDTRTFSGTPFNPGRLVLVYNKVDKTLAWSGVDGLSFTTPVESTSLAFQSVLYSNQVIADLPGYRDCNYYRQQSAVINTRTVTDTTEFFSDRLYDFATEQLIYQPDAVLLPSAGSELDIFIPKPLKPACTRIGVLAKPSQIISLLGFQNTAGVSAGTTAPIALGQQLDWILSLPGGVTSIAMRYSAAASAEFDIVFSINGTILFSGRVDYTDGVIQTPTFTRQLPAGSAQVSVLVNATDGLPFIVNSIDFTTDVPANSQITYSLACSMKDVGLINSAAQSIVFGGKVGRFDCASFDICWGGSNATFASFKFDSPSNICLYLYVLDVKQFDARTLSNGDPAANDAYKYTLLRLALASARRAYAQVPEQVFTSGTWDSAAQDRWTIAMETAQPGFSLAFSKGGPGDIGRLAILPSGIEFNGTSAVLTTTFAEAIPVLVTLQPWMIDFGARVLGPDFIPPQATGCASGNCQPLPTDFATIPTAPVPPPVAPAVVAITTETLPDGSQPGNGFEAVTATNIGASGGTWYQRLNVIATCTNLVIGVTYTLHASFVTTDLTTGATGTDATTHSFVATAVNEDVAFSTYTAPAGKLSELGYVSL